MGKKEDIEQGDKDYEEEMKRRAEMDKKYPRLAEPDEEGIDFALNDPRRRFISIAKGTIFRQAAPLTDAEKAEADALWEKITGGNYTEK
jgi:hypothetical protein